jgi:hypothetical protein
MHVVVMHVVGMSNRYFHRNKKLRDEKNLRQQRLDHVSPRLAWPACPALLCARCPTCSPLLPFFSRMLRTRTVCVLRRRLGLTLRLFQQCKTPMPRLLFPPQVLQLLLPTATMLMMSSKF